MKTALIIGATGLVGSHLVEQLAQNSAFTRIIVLSRRPVKYDNEKIEVREIDFDRPDSTQIKGDIVFCAIGTTIRKAGSKEKQYKIDCEYPAQLARIAKENGAKKFVLVSSIGADPRSSNFYLRTKGQLEEKLKALDYESLVIVRPSFILGNRKEFRLGEKIGIVIARALHPFMIGGLKKYRGVNASDIAAEMIAAANRTAERVTVISSEKITSR